MQASIVCLGLLSVVLVAYGFPFAGPNPYPGPNPMAGPMPGPMAGPMASPMAAPFPYPRPEPNCCGIGQACGLGLCGCCDGGCCENGACAPIIPYADGFFGNPRVLGGYGNTYGYGR